MYDLENAFAILGVAPDSDDATIRRAWRELVRSYHPAMARRDPVRAQRRLAEIDAAYDVVSRCTPDEIERLKVREAAREKEQQRRLDERRRAHVAWKAAQARRAGDRAALARALPAAAAALPVQEGDNAVSATADAGVMTICAEPAPRVGRNHAAVLELARLAFEQTRAICPPRLRPEAQSALF